MSLVEPTVDIREDTDQYSLAVDRATAWLMTNRNFGNTFIGAAGGWEANQSRALRLLSTFSTAGQLLLLRSDLKIPVTDVTDVTESGQTYGESVISANPDHILQMIPADCGVASISGFSDVTGGLVKGLVHIGRHPVGRATHLKAFDHMSERYGLSPEDLDVRVAPSARKESYCFEDIDTAQKFDPRWKGYLAKEDDGMWHVDVHGRAVDDLLAIGVNPARLTVSPVDTMASPDYYSNYHQQRGRQESGYNAVFIANS